MDRRTFKSPFDTFVDQHKQVRQIADFNGRGCDVLGLADPSGYDREEVGDMYRVRFDNGTETSAWPEELGYEVCVTGGQPFYHPDVDPELVDAFHRSWKQGEW